jgi:hypothetical protein
MIVRRVSSITRRFVAARIVAAPLAIRTCAQTHQQGADELLASSPHGTKVDRMDQLRGVLLLVLGLLIA